MISFRKIVFKRFYCLLLQLEDDVIDISMTNEKIVGLVGGNRRKH
jgi:hypothetical protein